MIGIGLDAVDLARFRATLARRPALLDRVFSAAELEELGQRADPVPGLAANFAAKEAALKALGLGLGAMVLRELEVLRRAGGAPYIRTSGRAADRAAQAGVSVFDVSLTHTDTVAAAVVVAR